MKLLLFFLFALWIIIGFFNVAYNSKKAISEVKEWFFLSDYEKRHKIFGDLYDFSLFLNQHTERDAKILLFSKDGMMYGVGRYYTYPRDITPAKDKNDFIRLIKSKQFKYVLFYDEKMTIDGYEQIAFFKSKTAVNFGSLYKQK